MSGVRLTSMRLAGAGVALVVLFAAGRRVVSDWPRVVAWVDGLGPWGPFAYAALYALAALAFVPGSVLTVTAGALFGLGTGLVAAFSGATLGAAAAFAVSRTIGRRWVERRFASDPRVGQIDRAIAAEGRRMVLLLRLSPIVPFNVLNYALGLTSVRFRDYLAGSIGMLPAAAAYVYSGTLAREAALVAAGAGHRDPVFYALLAVGLAATVVAATLLARAARRALRQASADGRIRAT